MDKQILPGLRITFLVHAITAFIFGLAYLLIPDTLLSLFAWPAQDLFVYRMVGAMELAFCASSWYAYREQLWEKVRIVVEMEAVLTFLGAVVSLWGVLFAGTPPAGWINFAIFFVFGIAFDYFLYRETTIVLKPQT